MSYSEDHIALAAEYALGTLDADERALVETMMIVDHGFKDVVDSWERKLAPLHQMVGAIEPPDYVWDNIKLAAGLTGKQVPMSEMPVFVEPPPAVEETPSAYIPSQQIPEAPPSYANLAPSEADIARARAELEAASRAFEATKPPEATKISPEIVVAPVASTESAAPSVSHMPERYNVVELPSRRRGSAAFGLLMTAVAASLAAVVSLQAYRPELLPEQLRVKPKIQTVEVKTPAPPAGAQFVALLQQDASLPAFILTVDTATKNFTVRKVGAVSEPGKSYELWLISDKLQGKPRSLGLIGNSDFTVRPALAAYDTDTINKATYAVTVEQEGGSPTGAPTSAPVFTGKLVESVPALPALNR